METAFEAAVKTRQEGGRRLGRLRLVPRCRTRSKDKALKVLARAVETNPTDEKLKASLTQLQNDKRLKMKPYEPHVVAVRPRGPTLPTMGGGGGGRRVQFINRR